MKSFVVLLLAVALPSALCTVSITNVGTTSGSGESLDDPVEVGKK